MQLGMAHCGPVIYDTDKTTCSQRSMRIAFEFIRPKYPSVARPFSQRRYQTRLGVHEMSKYLTSAFNGLTVETSRCWSLALFLEA